MDSHFHYQDYLRHSVGDVTHFLGAESTGRTDNFYHLDEASGTLQVIRDLVEGARGISNCPYCGATITLETEEFSNRIPGVASDSFGSKLGGRCTRCFWWFVRIVFTEDSDITDTISHFTTTYEGIICKFESDFWKDALCLAQQELAETRRHLKQLSPRGVERLMGEILSQYHQCDVHHVGRSGDRGIDLLVIVGEHPIAVQVKHRAANEKAEAVQHVREFVGSVLLEGYEQGLLVTTASRFSTAAQSAADISRRTIAPINLVSLRELRGMINNIASTQWGTYERVWQKER